MVGTANRRQWKDRQPMAHSTIAAVNSCTGTGTHPCVSGNCESMSMRAGSSPPAFAKAVSARTSPRRSAAGIVFTMRAISYWR